MRKIVFFTARYCGKCRALKRRFKDLENSLTDIDLIFSDIDIERSKARLFKVDGVPTLILMDNELEIKRLSGTILEEDILDFIK